MRVLLDTCVVSELQRGTCHPRVRGAVQNTRTRDLYLSVITVGELTKGIAMLGGGKKREALTDWFSALVQESSGRILPIDVEAARIWGELTASAQRRGKTVGAADGLIAATALRHGLQVMTRNTSDFCETGAMLTNPWDEV